MNFVVPRVALRTQLLMDQRTNSKVYVKVLNESMNIVLSISPSKEMGDCSRQRKTSLT